MRPGGGDAIAFLIAAQDKNVHGTRASAVIAKADLLSTRTKDFHHNTQDVNTFCTQKEQEITCGGEQNPDVLFQLFQTCESCPAKQFQESIGEMRRKHDRRDPSPTKKYLMAEALSSYDTLMLEKKWMTTDPKTLAFASFASKASALIDGLGGEGQQRKIEAHAFTLEMVLMVPAAP